MGTIKFEIDGKTYDFTSENFWKNFVIDSKGNIILKPKTSNPFERVKEGESFYLIGSNGDVMTHKENSLCFIEKYHNCANYCIDAELLQRRALYEKLERCLWRFSMENGGSGNYYPILNRATRRWSITCTEIQRFGPSFKTHDVCVRAIEEVIKPMLNGVDEEIFVWEGV
jgi:hypothetical protein